MNALGFQISKFVAVGILNTVTDVAVFNIFRRYKKITATIASYISTTIAMVQSYLLNRFWTFDSTSSGDGFEVIKFFFSTIIGLYIIHNGIIWFLTTKFKTPGNIFLKIVRKIKPFKKFGDEFITDNFAKLVAIFFSLTWNFTLYKFWVFVA